MASRSDTNLYHYTDQTGRDGILRDRHIRASTGGDGYSRFGDGVYFTSYKPSNKSNKILKQIYDGRRIPQIWDRLDYFVTIKIEVLNFLS